jgi:hypothetical protein
VKANPQPKPKKHTTVSKGHYFLSIPESEIEGCYIYEYACEVTLRSPRVLGLFTKWRVGCSGKKQIRRLPEAVKAYRDFRKIMTAFFPDFPFIDGDWFPKTAWPELNQKVRSALVRDVIEKHLRNSVPLVLELSKFKRNVAKNPVIEHAPLPFGEEDPSHMERGSFWINCSHSDGPIKAAFARSLRKIRADRENRGLKETNYPRKGRGSAWDRLHWLGALRQIRDYPRKELVHSGTDQIKAGLSFYSQYRDLRTAAQNARRLLDSFLSQVERI